jgi:hypothetical protein
MFFRFDLRKAGGQILKWPTLKPDFSKKLDQVASQ